MGLFWWRRSRSQSTGILVELHVPDFDEVKQFYIPLGFRIVWERDPDGKKGYLVLQMGDNVLCFWAGNEQVFNQDYFKRFPSESPRGIGVEIIVMVDSIEQFYERVKGHANVVDPLADRPWGVKDFRAVDPVGYYLRFTDSYDALDLRYRVA